MFVDLHSNENTYAVTNGVNKVTKRKGNGERNEEKEDKKNHKKRKIKKINAY